MLCCQSDRLQRVNVNGEASDRSVVESGVHRQVVVSVFLRMIVFFIEPFLLRLIVKYLTNLSNIAVWKRKWSRG